MWFALGATILSVGISVLAALYMLPFAWMLTFVVPAYLISALFVAFKFYLTGGLISFAFGVKPNDFYFNFTGNFLNNPIPYLFLIAFGIGLFYLLFQIAFSFFKKHSQKYLDTPNNSWINWRYVFYFFASIILIPILFLLLNLGFGGVINILELLSIQRTQKPVTTEQLILYLDDLKQQIPDYPTIETNIQNWIANLQSATPTIDSDALKIANQILGIYKQYFQYLNIDKFNEIINGLNTNNLTPLINTKIFFNNNFLPAQSQLNQYINQLSYVYQIELPSNLISSFKQLNDFYLNFVNADTNQFINQHDIFSNPLITNLYQSLTGFTDTNWTKWFGVVGTEITNPLNWVQILLTSLTMSSILIIMISFTINAAMLVFQVIYQLLVVPFTLAKGLDDDGILFHNWLKTTIGLFVTLFVIAFCVSFLNLFDPIMLNQINNTLNGWITNNTTSTTAPSIVIKVVSAIFVCASFMAAQQFANFIKNKTMETNTWTLAKTSNPKQQGQGASDRGFQVLQTIPKSISQISKSSRGTSTIGGKK